jgi:hypothetical protein
MCRSIKKLRLPAGQPTQEEVLAAALQYVRKVSGFRKPSRGNQAVFDQAVAEITASTRMLLASLEVQGERKDQNLQQPTG